jgi:hypothetical protein
MAANAAPAPSSMMKTSIARRAVRPEAAASLAEVTPITTSDTTSGTTVICKALSQSRPIGCMNAAAVSAVAGEIATRTRPATAPAIRASRTRVVIDMGGRFLEYAME